VCQTLSISWELVEAVLDLSQLASQIAAAVVFLVPGLNTTWVLDRLVGQSTLAGTERLLKALSWSILIYLAASPWLFAIRERLVHGELGLTEFLWAGATLFVAAPAVLGALVGELRRFEPLQRWFRRATGIHPAPTAWDFAFETLRKGFVRVRLVDGRLLGGYYGANSFASSYPEPQDVFVEQAWSLHEDESFVDPVSGGQGLLIRRDAIQSVQFLRVGEDHVQEQ
jgi:hypothetical protein